MLELARTALRFPVFAVAGFVLGIALALALPLLFDARPLTVLSGSMEPALGTGDVTVVQRIGPLEARPGDIVTFRDPANQNRLVTHRVRGMRVRGGSVAFVTRGDANNVSERWAVSTSGEISRVVYRIPELGRVLVLARTNSLPMLLFGLALAALLVLELMAIPLRARSRTPGLSHSFLNLFPHRGVADARRLLQQLNLVAGLDHAGARHGGPAVDDVEAELVEASKAGMSRLSMPIFSFSTLCSLSTSITLSAMRPAMYGTAPSAHCQVMAGRMRPSIQGRSIFAHCRSEPAVSNSVGLPSAGTTA